MLLIFMWRALVGAFRKFRQFGWIQLEGLEVGRKQGRGKNPSRRNVGSKNLNGSGLWSYSSSKRLAEGPGLAYVGFFVCGGAGRGDESESGGYSG